MKSVNGTRTHIIASLGLASYDREIVRGMMEAGVYMFRGNFSHMSHDAYQMVQQMVHELNTELGTNVLLQVDLQGPHIRIGEIAPEGIKLIENESYTFITLGEDPQVYDIPINDATIHEFIEVGQPISFLNGSIEAEVTRVEGHRITAKMHNTGTIRSRKAINLPETQLDSCLTSKDRADLAFLVEQGVDWLALSFVSEAHELEEVRTILGNKPVKVMSKLERRAAVTNMAAIIEASDAVMVARGDLGIELPMEDVPFIQKDVIHLSHQAKKPAIVATQMLLSMVHSQRPTRAEVADVAQAVCERADALMLSDETTEGIDPVNAVKTMQLIIHRAEAYLYERPNYFGGQRWE